MLRDEENIKKIETIMITRTCRIYLEQQGKQIFRKNMNLLINTKLSRYLEKSIVCPMKLKQESRIEFKLTSPRELKPKEKWTENECAWEIERGRWYLDLVWLRLGENNMESNRIRKPVLGGVAFVKQKNDFWSWWFRRSTPKRNYAAKSCNQFEINTKQTW